MAFQVGLEVLESGPEISQDWGRCAYLANQASVDRGMRPGWNIMHELLGDRLVAFFGPQHGFASTVQDNMIETGHGIHAPTGMPVYSLYSETREPTSDMLENVDTIICDLQIVGCRIYTWKATIAGCMRAAKANNKKVVILDRPNPLSGSRVEGMVLDSDAKSFVGEYPVPMRHGLTAGEAATYFNRWIECDLEVVPLQDWNPDSIWGDLGREWVLTSPNLPTPDSMYVFPGLVMLEGTMISEGRGTCLPFQMIGHPAIKSSQALMNKVKKYAKTTPGIILRESLFHPMFQKWAERDCTGFQIHVLEPRSVRSFRLGLAIMKAFYEELNGGFEWKPPPYEYDYTTLPIKLIMGSLIAHDRLMEDSFDADDEFWSRGVEEYITRVKPFLIYPREMKNVT